MQGSRVRRLMVSAALLALPALVQAAESYPTKPIRVLVPQPPGGTTDAVARLFGVKMTETLGQQVIVDNRSGGGMAGVAVQNLVAASAPDGYTVLAIVPNFTFTGELVKEVKSRPEDFAPVTLLSHDPYLLSVYPGVPAKSVKELVALAKSKPGYLNMGSGNIGSGTHLISMFFISEAGVRKEVTYVPYKGTGLAFTDLMAGRIHMAISSIVSGGPHVKSGKLNALGVTSAARSASWPDVPTIAEQGLRGFEATAWYGLVVPAKTPPAIVNKLSSAAGHAAKTPEVSDRIRLLGGEAVGSSPAELRQLITREIPRWRKLIRELGMAGTVQ